MSTTGTEIVGIDTWIYQTIYNDTTMQSLIGPSPYRVFNTQVPEETTWPWVVFQMLVPRDLMIVNADRIWVDASYQIKASAVVGDYTPLQTIASRIDALFHKPSVLQTPTPLAGGIVLESYREAPLAVTEVHEGRQFRHLGGVYSIKCQSQ